MSVSLSAQHLVKRYGGVVALADGNLNVQSGQVVALLGANGSGKSTLSKIVTGVVAPNEGQLHLDGQIVRFNSPQHAKKLGITAVYQELSLVPEMSIAENVWLAHEPMRFGIRIDRQVMHTRTEELLTLFEGVIPPTMTPNTPILRLAPDERQIIEILKAISLKPRLMILDEATASLDNQQVTRLFDLIKRWKADGMAIVFVSHRMEEIFRVADTATVLRNGASVGTVNIADTTESELVQMMIEGTTTPVRVERELPADAPVRLSVNHLITPKLADISFDLRDGELLGIGGLQGQGQADLLLALFGVIPHQGDVRLSGQRVNFRHPRQAMENDVAFVPGDRANEGLLLIRSILDNLLLPSWRQYGLPLNLQEARKDSTQITHELNVVMSSLEAPVNSLSGGNAQKIVIGKWLLRNPKLLLLNDPTKGVDVGAKGEFYKLLGKLTESGTAILFYSSDDEELLGLCDRVLVMHDGGISAELTGASVTRENLVSASMGTRRTQKETTA